MNAARGKEVLSFRVWASSWDAQNDVDLVDKLLAELISKVRDDKWKEGQYAFLS